MHSFQPLSEREIRNVSPSLGTQYTLIALLQGELTPLPSVKYSPNKPGPLDILQNIILVPSVGDSMLLGPEE